MKQLKSIHIPDVFNPYTDQCEFYDHKTSSSIRSQNLRLFFEYLEFSKPSDIWVAESLGYKGGRRTGLPLTDLEKIKLMKSKYQIDGLQLPNTEMGKEMTATQIWTALDSLSPSELPFLWNIFPFHPHKVANPLSNRGLSSREVREFEQITSSILDNNNFERIVTIGKRSEAILTNMGYQVIAVRHPSHGGAKIFRDQIRSIYAS